jgi:hypothetical protein
VFRAGYQPRRHGPGPSVQETDGLVAGLMKTRGYPMDDFQQREADVSVDHPQVVEHYRPATVSRWRTTTVKPAPRTFGRPWCTTGSCSGSSWSQDVWARIFSIAEGFSRLDRSPGS